MYSNKQYAITTIISKQKNTYIFFVTIFPPSNNTENSTNTSEEMTNPKYRIDKIYTIIAR